MILSLLLVLHWTSASAIATPPLTAQQKREEYRRLFPPYHTVPEEAREWLQKISRNEFPSGVEDRESFFNSIPDFFKANAVRFYDSGSNQFASPENPRQIFQSADGILEIGLSGNPVAGEKEARAMLKLNKDPAFAQELLDRAIAAQREGVHQLIELQKVDEDALFSDTYEKVLDSDRFAQIKFHEKHPTLDWEPARCTGCHSQEINVSPRVSIKLHNWAGYPVWPGQFGSVDDRIRKGSREDLFLDALTNRLRSAKELPPSERGLLKFVNSKEEDPNRNGEGWQLSQSGTMFSNVLATGNAFRIARALGTHPAYFSYRYALLAAISNCEPIESFIPKSGQEGFTKTYSSLLQDTKNKLFAFQKQVIAKAEKFAGEVPEFSRRSYFDEKESERIAALRYVVENGFRVDTRGWFYTQPRSTFEFGSANFNAELKISLMRELLYAAKRGEKDMDMFPLDDCAWLKKKAVLSGVDLELKESDKAHK